jgi:hypothetical protein
MFTAFPGNAVFDQATLPGNALLLDGGQDLGRFP